MAVFLRAEDRPPRERVVIGVVVVVAMKIAYTRGYWMSTSPSHTLLVNAINAAWSLDLGW